METHLASVLRHCNTNNVPHTSQIQRIIKGFRKLMVNRGNRMNSLHRSFENTKLAIS